jgi:hypothetical protein
LFVALAETDGNPMASAAGNEMKLPPPAAALIALATNAATPTKTRCETVRGRRRPARSNVGFVDRSQIVRGHGPAAGEEARRLPQARPVDRVADAARIGELRLFHAQIDVFEKCTFGSRRERIVELFEHQIADRAQLVERVIRKIDVVRDARTQARIAREKRVHPVFVAGEDHDEILALILHDL